MFGRTVVWCVRSSDDAPTKKESHPSPPIPPGTSSSPGRATHRTATATASSAKFRVNTYTTETQRFPSVAANASGSFVVVWQSDEQDGPSYGVFGQRYGQIVPVELMRFGVE
jgi:hypothetical protein